MRRQIFVWRQMRKDLHKIREISPEVQQKVVKYMKSKNKSKDQKRLSKRGIEEEKR